MARQSKTWRWALTVHNMGIASTSGEVLQTWAGLNGDFGSLAGIANFWRVFRQNHTSRSGEFLIIYRRQRTILRLDV
jgi:hypothetical protein